MKNIIMILAAALLFLTSCEDATDLGTYEPQNVVEAYLIVDEPVQNILLINSKTLADKYDYNAALIRDAKVIIKGDGQELLLAIDPEGKKGYYDPAAAYKIKPETEYELYIELANGDVITGKTTTPPRTAWIKDFKDKLQFPLDTIKLPASDTITWARVEGNDFYPIQYKALDTTGYGVYLDPPTDEMNRRIMRPNRSENAFKDVTVWALIANNTSPLFWNALRWYGRHEVVVYVPDENFLEWWIQNRASREYNELLSSVEGKGIGCFGSASVVRDTVFVMKNQP